MLSPCKKSYDKPRQHIKQQRHHFANKFHIDKYVSWLPKSWCFLTVVLKKTLDSPLDCKEIKSVNPKGNWHWIFIGRTDAKAPILWLPDEKNWHIGKDPDAGEDWRQEKGETEWNGCHALPTWWTWVWASSGRQWRTGKPSVLQSMGSQRVGHNLVTEQQQAVYRHIDTKGLPW